MCRCTRTYCRYWCTHA
ncbi:hypothetical protein SND98_01345, partial [Escherichia coli]|nr:hypothetical protein [Escherichia coli]